MADDRDTEAETLARAYARRLIKVMVTDDMHPAAVERARASLDEMQVVRGFAQNVLRCCFPHPHKQVGLAWFARECPRWPDRLPDFLITKRLGPHVEDITALVLGYYASLGDAV